jgi:hypothetical protein
MNWRPRGKYGAKRESYAGYSFASGLERKLFEELKLREAAGELKDIQVQASVHLTDAKILYKPDFKAYDMKLNNWVWHEAKGFETDVWKIKLRLWRYYGPGRLEIYKGSRTKIYLHDVIEGRPGAYELQPVEDG